MPCPKTGATHYHAQLGLPYNHYPRMGFDTIKYLSQVQEHQVDNILDDKKRTGNCNTINFP